MAKELSGVDAGDDRHRGAQHQRERAGGHDVGAPAPPPATAASTTSAAQDQERAGHDRRARPGAVTRSRRARARSAARAATRAGTPTAWTTRAPGRVEPERLPGRSSPPARSRTQVARVGWSTWSISGALQQTSADDAGDRDRAAQRARPGPARAAQQPRPPTPTASAATAGHEEAEVALRPRSSRRSTASGSSRCSPQASDQARKTQQREGQQRRRRVPDVAVGSRRAATPASTGTATAAANMSGRPPRRWASATIPTTDATLTSRDGRPRSAPGPSRRAGQREQPEEQRARGGRSSPEHGRVARRPRPEQRRVGGEDVERADRDQRVVGHRRPSSRRRRTLAVETSDRQPPGQHRPDAGGPPSGARSRPGRCDPRPRRRGAAPQPGDGHRSDQRHQAHDPPDAPGQRLVAELHAVPPGRQRGAAQQVVHAMQVGGLAVERHLPAGVVQVGEHELGRRARPSPRPPRARARRRRSARGPPGRRPGVVAQARERRAR